MDDSAALVTPPHRVGPLHPSWKLPAVTPSPRPSCFPTKPGHLSTTAKPLHSSSFPPQNGAVTPKLRPPHLDLELLSLKSSESYTSLKDLLPSSSFAAVQSPTPNPRHQLRFTPCISFFKHRLLPFLSRSFNCFRVS
ncbi:hypothetical protein M0R45_029924 [Rubus argutus]|uniref:Uncharacterized protein n=1 Tax=Rubus argutus TaxID=59490 RepID=A0AAW1W9F2_RUBAR